MMHYSGQLCLFTSRQRNSTTPTNLQFFKNTTSHSHRKMNTSDTMKASILSGCTSWQSVATWRSRSEIPKCTVSKVILTLSHNMFTSRLTYDCHCRRHSRWVIWPCEYHQQFHGALQVHKDVLPKFSLINLLTNKSTTIVGLRCSYDWVMDWLWSLPRNLILSQWYECNQSHAYKDLTH